MINKFLGNKFSIQFLYFIFLLINVFSQEIDIIEKDSIIKSAFQNGYNLTNLNDDIFLDLCIHFTYYKKDVTLEYRQKYFYFPNDSNSSMNFTNPKRNNTLSCFTSLLDIKYVLINITILIQFPLFIYQLTALLVAIYINPENIFYNEPEKQVKMNKKGKKFKYASELVEEKKNDENNNETNLAVLTKDETDDNEKKLQKKDSDEYLETNDKVISEINDEDLEKEIKRENKESNRENDKNNEEIIGDNKDFITFGLDVINNENFNKAQKEMNKNQIKQQSKEEKRKDAMKVFNAINEERHEEEEYNNNPEVIRRESNKIKLKKKEDIVYSREEFFYFEFAPEIIYDKRSIYDIYLDLLNQCQFIFKFFCISYNIYEDRKLQLLYYTFKINLYFLFNIILTTNNVINRIFDNKNSFKDDIYRSLLSCILTYFIGLFIYNLTNIKRILIKRRKKIINLRISDKQILKEFKESGKVLSLDFLINKLKILLFLLIIFSAFIMIISFGFCIIFKYTQLTILKCVIYSCIISQSSPFLLCWIPSFLRKMFIKKRKEFLLIITQLIESLFIP